ncbi:MAG: hypothetical protein K9J16_08155 [Melioribacteraceae bacterium]|nr:hypothetical protein [Melioribacteraceae bacterium]MCF8353875.1 hypothetical protein [Melioribacteraceae bacterium]MCF8393108.1 hypothetical protein [Melioribacteraceae bacterium]MCF8419227.1 hypothetical protein [Melioribacteraceae bacterium]
MNRAQTKNLFGGSASYTAIDTTISGSSYIKISSTGALKSIAQSGAGENQYTTNPGSLTYPLSGVTFVQLSAGGEWNPSNIDGSGVLIVHNNTCDAALKNMNWGTFKGLIISDKLLHVHSNVIGGIVILSNSAAHGRNLGNGNGVVQYSGEAIEEAAGAISSTASAAYGFAKARIEILEWDE